MGPLRGRLIALLTLLPAPAMARVCENTRPDWVATDGPVGAVGEAVYVLTSPVGLILMGLALLALIWPRRWLAVIVALPVLALAGLLVLSRQAEVAVQAMAEGCIGGIWPVVVLLVVIAAAVLVRGFNRSRGAP